MFDRRNFLTASAAAALASSVPALGQADTRIYGTPAGTAPFPPEVYRERRQRLMQQIKGGVALIYGAATIDRSSDVAGVGRQNSDFAYLTGIMDEPGAALILAPGERTHREYLFLPPINPEVDRWEGIRLSITEELKRRVGIEKIYRTSSLGSTLADVAARAGAMHYLGPVGHPDAAMPRELDIYGRVAARIPGTRIVNSSGLIEAMRLVKEPRELDLMRRAIAATRRGILAVMKSARPGMTERDLKAILETEFRAGGGTGWAYSPIVAVARNSAVLHYTAGDNVIRAGDLILLDVGAEHNFYASDITRTFPIDGRFTPEQRRIYDIVLAAQDAAAAQLRPGAYYEDLNKTASDVIARAGHADDFWHGLGHFVGLDVHDAGESSKPLPAGAVLTIEPGIYLPQRNFGIRIEDEYLVTANGRELLSRDIPRTAAEVEAAMAR